MRWATFQIPPATTERIGVVRGDEIYAMAAGPKLIDLLGDDGERLAAAGAKTLASPAEVVRVDRVRLLPPISRPPGFPANGNTLQHIVVVPVVTQSRISTSTSLSICSALRRFCTAFGDAFCAVLPPARMRRRCRLASKASQIWLGSR